MGNFSVTDQMGNTVRLNGFPERIVSLVPSQTELLHDLGLKERVVGITKFCVHPEAWYRTKTRVGGTKQYNFETIRGLRPDLIIGNKEENDEEQVRLLQQEFPVWMSDIHDLNEALEMIDAIGKLTDTSGEAENICSRIITGFDELASTCSSLPPARVVYLIWNKPYMAAGKNTFIDSMLQRLNLQNALTAVRYPELTANDLNMLRPDCIFLSSEPYPFKDKHLEEIRRFLPDSKLLLVDGEMFSWYGTRLLQAPDYFRQLLRTMTS